MKKLFDIGKVIFNVGIYLILVQGNTVFAANDYSSQINQMNLILDAIDEGKDVSEEDLTILENGMKTVNGIAEDKLTDETRILKQRYEANDEAQKKIIDKHIIQAKEDKQAYEKAADENEGQTKYLLKKEAASKNTEIALLENKKEQINNYCFAKDTKCSPYCKYKDQVKEECWLCPVFAVVFNAVSSIGQRGITVFSDSVAKLVIVGFGVWLALQILAFVSSIETRDLKDLMSSIIAQGFVVVLVFTILQTGVKDFYTAFVNPVYDSGLRLSQAMFDNPELSKKWTVNSEEDTKENKNIEKAKRQTTAFGIENNGALPASMGVSIVRTMTIIENQVRRFKALGSSMMCQSWVDSWFIFPRMIYLMTGLGLWVLSMVVIVGVPFLMIDAVFQLGVAAALLPIAVGGFAFKATRQYTKKVWETFLNSMFSFVFISIVVLLILAVLQEALTDSVKAINTQSVDPQGNLVPFDFNQMFERGNAGKVSFEALVTSFQWASPHFIKLACVFLLAWSVMNMAKEFAGEFASSISDTAIGSSIGTMAASAGKGMALKATSPTRKFLGEQGRKLATRAVRAPGRAAKAAYQGIRDFRTKKKFDKVAADANGRKSFTDKKGRQYTLENDVVTIKQLKNGKETTTVRSKDMTFVRVKQMKEVNGKLVEVYHDEMKISSSRMDKIIGADGMVNKKELDSFLNGISDEHKEAARVALTKSIVKERVGINGYNDSAKKLSGSETVSVNEETGETLIREVTADGEVIFTKMKIRDDGYLETSVVKADAKGKVTVMSSDGIHNKMEEFRLNENIKAETLKDIDQVFGQREKDKDGNNKSSRVSYGYTKYYRDRIDHGADASQFDRGMLSEEEAENCREFYFSKGNEFQKADMNIRFR